MTASHSFSGPDPTLGLSDASDACESILRGIRARYVDGKVWPSHVCVIDRLLSRRLELREAYFELDAALLDWRAMDMLFDAVLVAAAHYNPAQINKARDTRTAIERANADIALAASELAQAMRRRSELCNKSSFSTDTHSHIIDVMEEAAADGNNPLFRAFLLEDLDALRSRFDLKYWPTLESCIEVIATDADRAITQAFDELTLAATGGPRRVGAAGFIKALLKAIEQRTWKRGCFLPEGYRPTDRTLASLANCALDLAPEDTIDAPQVKTIRQRLRRKAATESTSVRKSKKVS